MKSYADSTQISVSGLEQGLLLKTASDASAALKVAYVASAHVVRVFTFTSAQGWAQRGADISVTMNNGDQLGARAKSNGDVEVYRNGSLLGTVSVTAWTPYSGGGYIGLWYSNASGAIVDDFGGGNVSASATATPTNTSTPTNTNTSTITRTPTVTTSPAGTMTPSRTLTPANTLTPSRTPTITASTTLTNTPTFTPAFTSMPTSTPPPSGPVTINYAYDPLYRLTEANYSNGNYYHYAYDAVGNRLSQTTQLAVNSYQYDVANHLKFVNGVEYFWDANGNLLNDGVNTYVYDSANRLTALSNQQSASSYGYNGLGDRLTQSVNGDTANYTLDLNTGLTQVLNDGTNSYLYGLGRIAQVNTTTEYFLGDALGSVRQLTDAQGEITLAKSYAPYGETLSSVGGGTSPFAFTGEQQDVSGLTYLRARYYSSSNGRFTSKDTWMGDYNSPLSLNRWMYVEGNPINATDPSGHITENQAARADLILEKLRTYNIHIVRDWGHVLRTADPSSLPPFILTGILYNHCEWQDGRWSLNELELVLNTTKRVNLQTHGRLNRLIKPVKVLLTDFSWCPSNWRGCTSWGGTEIRLKDNGLPSPGSDLKQYFKKSASEQNFDVFTLVHELGHSWDLQNGGQYATGLIRYTKGSYIIRGPSLPLQCHITDVIGKEDLNHKKPGCNDARYRYGGIPAYGADIYFNAGEDFANSFAAYIFPTDAQQVIDAKYNDPSKNPEEYKLNKYLYYSDYTKMPRWIYVDNLVNGFSPSGK